MNITIFIVSFSVTFIGVALYSWYHERRQCRQWQKLERIQAARIAELIREKEFNLSNQVELEKFRTRPGMESVSDVYARKFLDLETENIKLTKELNAKLLEAAKYMDLYRQEKYLPKRKHT